MGIGLAILATGACTVITSGDAISRVVLGGLTAMGGAFSGYLSSTFLRAHERALQQVNYLFSQPLVSHYLEYGRSVATDLSTPQLRDKALTGVIDRSRKSAGIAVMTRAPETPAPRITLRRRSSANGQGGGGQLQAADLTAMGSQANP